MDYLYSLRYMCLYIFKKVRYVYDNHICKVHKHLSNIVLTGTQRGNQTSSNKLLMYDARYFHQFTRSLVNKPFFVQDELSSLWQLS